MKSNSYTAVWLCDAIAERLKEVAESYSLETSLSDEKKALRIYVGDLPPKLYEGDADSEHYPFILIVLQGGDDSDAENAKVNVAIAAGAFDEDGEGWRIAADVVQRIRSRLYENPRIGPYELTSKSWALPDEQPEPFAICTMHCQWSYALPYDLEFPMPYSHEKIPAHRIEDDVKSAKLERFMNGE